jgi:chemotaxis protein MotA
MTIIIGFIILVGGTMAGYMIAGANPKTLFALSEIIIIFSMMFGAMIIMAPMNVLKEIVKMALAVFKGAPFKKVDFEELLKVMYELFVLGRRNGMIALEEHVMNPAGSSLFKKYPTFYNNHAAVEFFCDGLRPIVDGRIKPDQLEPLMTSQLEALTHEKLIPAAVLTKIADALPGFGIVAAVMGVVFTMSNLGGGMEKIGQMIAHALTGTLLGIFLCYGVVGPMATNIEFYNQGELNYLKCIKSAVVSFAQGLPPLVAAEVGRRVLEEQVRPNAIELETMLKTMATGK